jgi:hypothetical protein
MRHRWDLAGARECRLEQLYGGAAAILRRSRLERRADRDGSRNRPPAQASKCLQRRCLPECLVQKKTAADFEALVGALLAASRGRF